MDHHYYRIRRYAELFSLFAIAEYRKISNICNKYYSGIYVAEDAIDGNVTACIGADSN